MKWRGEKCAYEETGDDRNSERERESSRFLRALLGNNRKFLSCKKKKKINTKNAYKLHLFAAAAVMCGWRERVRVSGDDW